MAEKPQYDSIGDEFVAGKQKFFASETDFARKFILKNLTSVEGKTLLDIGCGAGDDLSVYEAMPFGAVFGVDPSPVMIEKAKAASAHPERITVGDFEHTNQPGASVDFAVSRYALHYIDHFEAAYSEVARVLKPGGFFVFTVDHPVADAVEGEKFLVGGRKHVRIKLYNGAVTIEFPVHNFSDYISPAFLKLFELLEVVEDTGKDREYQDGPNALAFVARKKS